MFELFLLLEDFNNLYVDKRGMRQMVLMNMPQPQQREIAERITDLEDGSVYVSHVNWIDFAAFDLPKPIYVNMVRDPVERVISWYYYVRSSYRNAVFFQKFPQREVKPAEWYKKNFNDCVRNGDPECSFVQMQVKDPNLDFRRQSLFYCGHNPDCL